MFKPVYGWTVSVSYYTVIQTKYASLVQFLVLWPSTAATFNKSSSWTKRGAVPSIGCIDFDVRHASNETTVSTICGCMANKISHQPKSSHCWCIDMFRSLISNSSFRSLLMFDHGFLCFSMFFHVVVSIYRRRFLYGKSWRSGPTLDHRRFQGA